jgi:hypothetical protein
MKIIVSGNMTWGLCEVIYKQLSQKGHIVHCFSSSVGIDLCTYDGRERFKSLSIGYDVFINCVKLGNFCQTLLLKEVWDHWMAAKKTGHIINIGSTVDTGLKGGSRLYTTEKVALKNMSRKLTYDTLSGSGIKVTYVSLGYLNTPGVSFKDKNKIRLEDVVDTIQWVLESPIYININEISMDPIQEI